jgi:hypothetical protein
VKKASDVLMESPIVTGLTVRHRRLGTGSAADGTPGVRAWSDRGGDRE